MTDTRSHTLLLFLILLSSPLLLQCAYFFYLPHARDLYVTLAPVISSSLMSSVGVANKVQVFLYGSDLPYLNSVFGKSKTVKAPLAYLQQSDWADATSYSNYQSAVGSDGYLNFDLSEDEIIYYLRNEIVSSMNELTLHECTSIDSDVGPCFTIYMFDTNKLLDNNKRGYWGDRLTASLYNLIANNEIKNPGSQHVCLGSPRDCNSKGSASPEYLSCWYAAKQLMMDIPNAVSGTPWNFQFYLASAPYFNTSVPPGPTTMESAQAKIEQVYGWSYRPSYDDLSSWLSAKQKVGDVLRKFDRVNGKYALAYHTAPIEFVSTTNNPRVYKDSMSFVASSATFKSCPLPLNSTDPLVVRSVPSSYAITGYPPLPLGTVMSVGSWVTVGLFVFFFVCVGGFMFIRFCCDLSSSSDNTKYTNF